MDYRDVAIGKTIDFQSSPRCGRILVELATQLLLHDDQLILQLVFKRGVCALLSVADTLCVVHFSHKFVRALTLQLLLDLILNVYFERSDSRWLLN